MTVLRILGGALLGVVIATSALLILIVLSEWAIAKGWVDAYDDATMGLVMMVILVGAPVIGGWKAWVGRRS